MSKYFSVIVLVLIFLVLGTPEAKRQKHKKNRGKVFDPSLIFHALTADEETNLGDDVDKVYEYTKDAAPRTNSKSAKNKKKHKKKHKKRHDKGHKQSKTCCQNGGLCVMGAFCHCPSGFEGRYCEHKVTTRSCGPIKHKEVFRDGCTLCQCMDGILHCLPGVYSECEDGQMEPIFYNFNEEVKPTAASSAESDTDTKQDPILKKLRKMEEEKQGSSGAVETTAKSNIVLIMWTILVIFCQM